MRINAFLTTTAFVGFAAAFAAPAAAQTTTTAATPESPVCPDTDPKCTTNAQERAVEPGASPVDNPKTDQVGEVANESGTAPQAEAGGVITVTGTRINRPTLESNVPITSLSQDDLTAQGDVNVGDALNDLPSLRSTFSQANSTRFIGTAGANFLDLRGLGEARTLVLVNGRRHVSSTAGVFRVDINTIPTDLIERVDIVTGGNSAVYGSDAVAGVVNFVLKRDFDGLRLRGQGGVSQRGDRAIEFISGTYGKNFSDGRGNVALNLEYVNAEPYYNYQREDLTGAREGGCAFVTAEPQGVAGGEVGPSASDGIPDTQFLCKLRSTGISNGGLINAASPLVGATAVACTDPRLAPGGTGAASGAARCVRAGTSTGQLRQFTFTPTGTLVESIPTNDLRPFGSGFSQGGNGSTVSETQQLAPGLDRFAANFLAHYDISDALRPFLEAKYVHIRALQSGQPSFFQGGLGGFFGPSSTGQVVPELRCNNPFLTAPALAQLQAVGRCLTPATNTFSISRFNIDFGPRGEVDKRDTYRVLGGVEGTFNEDWKYEVSANYGRTKTVLTNQNDLQVFDQQGNLAGFALAIDAVRDPSGNIVCRVNADAIATNDAPGCIPINPFGEGFNTTQALDYINYNSTLTGVSTEFDALAFVSGDMSQLFELPGGPIRFSLGGEYRREKSKRYADPLSQSGGTFFNAFQPFSPPTFAVKELFGEVEAPLLKDLPFAHELTVSAAARSSDYNKGAGQTGKTFAYNLNGTYAPLSDLRFRGNYSKSVRAPTPLDLFAPLSQNFAFVSDPCDANFITNGPNRAANCAALGVPAGFVNTPARTQTIGFKNGGNMLLEEENSRSITLGGVLTPRFIPGFSLTVDYYNITVKNLIASLGAQTILNLCVDQDSINNQYCALINPRLPTGEFANNNNVLTTGGVNFAKQKARGIDFDLAYRKTFSNGHRLNLRSIATLVLERTNYVNPLDPKFGDRIMSELGDPRFNASASATYGIGNLDLRYSVNYIGKQTIGTYESQHDFQGRPATNLDQFPQVYYPDVFYHAARISYKVNNNYRAYVGVDNIGDRKPPLGLTGSGAGSGIFDNVGRTFYAGATVDF